MWHERMQVDFDEFLTALSKVADKKGQSLPEVVRSVLLAGGPTVNSTKASYIKFHDDKVGKGCVASRLVLVFLPGWGQAHYHRSPGCWHTMFLHARASRALTVHLPIGHSFKASVPRLCSIPCGYVHIMLSHSKLSCT